MDTNKMFQATGFSASIPGAGHIRKGIPCQDASAVVTEPRPALIVCDGRGSASHSHFGAQAAVKAFKSQVAVFEPMLVSLLDSGEADPDRWSMFCRILYRTLMQVKLDLSADTISALPEPVNEKEFDFTVACAVVGKKHIGCFQVGDGAIVLRQNEKCITAFEADKGEFANQTQFLREGGERRGKFHAQLFDATGNSGIAITSDGPEHLMFLLPDMIPGPVFDNMFRDLANGELVRQDIMDYLTRSAWNNDPRGADDRSLAILYVEPEEKTEPVPEAKVENEPESEPEPAPEIKPDSEPEPAPETTPEIKPEADSVSETASVPLPEHEITPVPKTSSGIIGKTVCMVSICLIVCSFGIAGAVSYYDRQYEKMINETAAAYDAAIESVRQKSDSAKLEADTLKSELVQMSARCMELEEANRKLQTQQKSALPKTEKQESPALPDEPENDGH